MSDNVEKYTHITSNHVDGYRYGEWTTLVGLETIRNRKGNLVECYVVRFDGGTKGTITDLWPVVDLWDDYRFK